MKFDKLNGPGNITKSLGIDQKLDGENILSGIINLEENGNVEEGINAIFKKTQSIMQLGRTLELCSK